MILDITLGSNDLARSARFYDAVFACLGVGRCDDPPEGWLGWGEGYDRGISLWLCTPFDRQPASHGNGTMVTLAARNAAEVRAVHAAGLANGGHDEGQPGTRPGYGADFYVAYLRDPDGNKLACAFTRYDPEADHDGP